VSEGANKRREKEGAFSKKASSRPSVGVGDEEQESKERRSDLRLREKGRPGGEKVRR